MALKTNEGADGALFLQSEEFISSVSESPNHRIIIQLKTESQLRNHFHEKLPG